MRGDTQEYARFDVKNEMLREVERIVLTLEVNGEQKQLLVPVHKTLLEVLREDLPTGFFTIRTP